MINPKTTITFQIRDLSLKIDRYVKSNYPIFNHDDKHFSKLQGMAAGYLFLNDSKEIFQRDLEHAMSISKSTASGLVSRMVKNGIIETTPSGKDARYKRLILRQEAKDAMIEVDASAQEIEKSLSEGISKEDMKTFFKVIKMISDNAE
ncbi:MarR family winged helix-turn-helix transcriptional regulator [Companilactobacillus keshanensis]|uniref:MarR family winged helix-turn-helix transcriptional regulator n=1 Tax=Companilactobacillus keshanensis TaxID=2486003 RepID=A0ABW4BSD3_9LACO|nr:MarR family winged helix-turn-helix transcriptional regulator [Companilactobacillus keshanensis]